jgi:hypothetical protein
MVLDGRPGEREAVLCPPLRSRRSASRSTAMGGCAIASSGRGETARTPSCSSRSTSWRASWLSSRRRDFTCCATTACSRRMRRLAPRSCRGEPRARRASPCSSGSPSMLRMRASRGRASVDARACVPTPMGVALGAGVRGRRDSVPALCGPHALGEARHHARGDHQGARPRRPRPAATPATTADDARPARALLSRRLNGHDPRDPLEGRDGQTRAERAPTSSA